MLKNICRLESTVNFPVKDAEDKEVMISRTGHFYCENDTPLLVVKEMILHFQKYVEASENVAKEQYEERIKKEQEILSVQDESVNIS